MRDFSAFDKLDLQAIPERLPMLEDFLRAYGHEHRKPLRRVYAVLIQHQFGSHLPMVRALVRMGLDPKRIYWVDIPYTANVRVQKALHRLGIPGKNFSPSDYHLGKPYAAYQRKRIQKLSNRDEVLVLDDGSYFLEAMACHRAPKFRLKIVEQTTRGIIKIRKDATLRHYAKRIPIVNVAESGPKKKLESPFIGEAICRSLIGLLKGCVRFAAKDKCLVLGYGAVGESVTQALMRHFPVAARNIYIGEPDPAKAGLIKKAGHPLWCRELHEAVRFKLVVGCSGTTSFGIGDRIFLEDGAFLASASSGASELSREEFIDLADSFPSDLIYVKNRSELEKSPVHSDIRIQLVDREACFLNGGFPVNFRGYVNCVPFQFIQLTRTLQAGAAVQAMNAQLPGLIDLDRRFCEFVENQFHRHKQKGVPA